MEGGDSVNSEDIESTRVKSPAERTDRVRENSPSSANRRIDQETFECLVALSDADRESLNAHIEDLSRESDMERYLQANASLLALAGTMAAAPGKKKWFIVPAVVFSFLFQHAVQGWCPPMPIYRRMGIRTRKEINREKYALKAVRGDFTSVPGSTREDIGPKEETRDAS